jgi:hypothetical protein
MVRAVVAVVTLAGALAESQSASAPLVVEATVVRECRVEVPRSAAASTFATMPVTLTCSHHSVTPRVQRPMAPQLGELRDAVVIINF